MELIIIAVNRWLLCEDVVFYSHVFKPPEAERFRLLEQYLFFFPPQFLTLTLSSTAAAATSTLFKYNFIKASWEKKKRSVYKGRFVCSTTKMCDNSVSFFPINEELIISRRWHTEPVRPPSTRSCCLRGQHTLSLNSAAQTKKLKTLESVRTTTENCNFTHKKMEPPDSKRRHGCR